MSLSRVLIALDSDAIATHAAQVGMELARSLKAELAFVHVIDPASMTGMEGALPADELVSLVERDAKTLVGSFCAQAAQQPPPMQFIPTGAPAAEILKVARQWRAEMIVVGRHSRGALAELLVGSVAEAVLRHASCPVLVVRPKDEDV